MNTRVITTHSPDELKHAVESDRICRAIGQKLTNVYPGHAWAVHVSVEGGVGTIRNPAISMEYGMVFYLNDTINGLQETAVRLAGELLERFKISREKEGVRIYDHIQKDLKSNAIAGKEGGF
jgi:hypothetical protein